MEKYTSSGNGDTTLILLVQRERDFPGPLPANLNLHLRAKGHRKSLYNQKKKVSWELSILNI